MSNNDRNRKAETMAFDLSIPDPEATKKEVEAQLEVEPVQAEAINDKANERGEQIMKVDMDSFADKRDIVNAIESLGADITKRSTAKNEMLSRRMGSLSAAGSESGEVAKGLEDLAITMRDLDPSGIDFAKKGRAGKLFNPVRRYFDRYKTADGQIASIVSSLEKGKKTLQADNTTLQLEEAAMSDLTKQLNQQIAIAQDLDTYLTGAIEQAKATNADDERIKFVEEEVLFPLRQKIMDFQQLLVVNQQGIVAMNVIRRNNLELIRAVDRAENVTVSALRVAVTVAGALYNQNIVLEKINALNETTNNMIAATSRMLKEQGAEIQRNAVEANISEDTLRQSFADTIQALEDISTYKQAALPKIKATIESFQEIADMGNEYIARLEAVPEAEAAGALPSA